jgi:hypothetical protein
MFVCMSLTLAQVYFSMMKRFLARFRLGTLTSGGQGGQNIVWGGSTSSDNLDFHSRGNKWVRTEWDEN